MNLVLIAYFMCLTDAEADYKVVCYYGAWAIYRQEPMTFSPSDVATHGCTHLIYSFVGLDPTDLTLTILDRDYDILRGKHLSLQWNILTMHWTLE